MTTTDEDHAAPLKALALRDPKFRWWGPVFGDAGHPNPCYVWARDEGCTIPDEDIPLVCDATAVIEYGKHGEWVCPPDWRVASIGAPGITYVTNFTVLEPADAPTHTLVGGRFISQEHLEQMQAEVARLKALVPEGHVVVPAELIAAVRRMLYAAFMEEDLEDYAEAINVFLDKMPPPEKTGPPMR